VEGVEARKKLFGGRKGGGEEARRRRGERRKEKRERRRKQCRCILVTHPRDIASRFKSERSTKLFGFINESMCA
jgi:hypothetical protein